MFNNSRSSKQLACERPELDYGDEISSQVDPGVTTLGVLSLFKLELWTLSPLQARCYCCGASRRCHAAFAFRLRWWAKALCRRVLFLPVVPKIPQQGHRVELSVIMFSDGGAEHKHLPSSSIDVSDREQQHWLSCSMEELRHWQWRWVALDQSQTSSVISVTRASCGETTVQDVIERQVAPLSNFSHLLEGFYAQPRLMTLAYLEMPSYDSVALSVFLVFFPSNIVFVLCYFSADLRRKR